MDDATDALEPENLVAAVLIADGVTASDAVNPAEALAVIPGVTVRFVGSEKGPKRTVPGPFKLVAEYTFEEIPHPDVFLTDQLAGPDVARAVQLGMEYDPQPPFDSGSLSKAKPEAVELCIKLMTAAMLEAGTPPEQVAMLAQAAAS